MQQEHLVMVRNEYPYLPEQLSFLCLLLFPIPFPQLPLTRYLTGIKTHHPEELMDTNIPGKSCHPSGPQLSL